MPMYDPLFMALAQAKAQPSKAYRTAMSALAIPGQAAEGLSEGYKIKRMIQQPEAMARIFAATPMGEQIMKNSGPDALIQAMYGMEPKDTFADIGNQARLEAQQRLGMAGIRQRDTASQRASDAANRRTGAMEDIFSGGNLTKNIGEFDNQIAQLDKANNDLAAKLPPGVSGVIRNFITNGGVAPDVLKDPQLAAITAQMKSNNEKRNALAVQRKNLQQRQGLISRDLLDNSDLGTINPPGGDNSIPGEVVPGVSTF